VSGDFYSDSLVRIDRSLPPRYYSVDLAFPPDDQRVVLTDTRIEFGVLFCFVFFFSNETSIRTRVFRFSRKRTAIGRFRLSGRACRRNNTIAFVCTPRSFSLYCSRICRATVLLRRVRNNKRTKRTAPHPTVV